MTDRNWNPIQIFDQVILLTALCGNFGSLVWLTLIVGHGGMPVDPEFHAMLRLSIYVYYFSPIAFALSVVRLTIGGHNILALCAAGLGFIGSCFLLVIWFFA